MLNEIIHATENAMRSPLRVTSARELIALSGKGNADEDAFVMIDREKEFYLNLYLEAFENLSFIFKQRVYALTSAEFICPWTRMAEFDRRLSKLITGMDINKEEVLPYLFLFLNSFENHELIRGLVYAAASMDLERPYTLLRLLEAFCQCAPDRLPCFIAGLSHGLNPRITEKLTRLLPDLSGDVAHACMDILSYRNDADGEDLSGLFQTHSDPGVRLKAALVHSRSKDADALSFLFERYKISPAGEKEAAVYALLCAGHPKAVELCRELCVSARAPFMPTLLMLSGKPEDTEFLIGRFHETSDPETKTAIVSALGWSGSESAVQFLFSLDGGHEEPSLRALALISGESLESVDAYRPWRDGVKNRFPENGRLRNGKVWSFAELTDTVARESSTADLRRTAVDEFVIRSGRFVRFEPEMPVALQLATIAGMNDTVDRHLKDAGPWMYGGQS
jgi:hypothetical protein